MMPGIPPQQYKHFLSSDGDIPVSCWLSGADLYVLYSFNENPDHGDATFLKKIDLNSFSGDEWGQKNIYSRCIPGDGLVDVCLADDAIIIYGESPEILTSDGLQLIYSERDGCLNPEWDSDGLLKYRKGYAYRSYGFHCSEKGVDVVDVRSQQIVRHLDLDIRLSEPWHGDLVFGQRANGRFAIYSLTEERFLFELGRERYCFRMSNVGEMPFSVDYANGYAYVLAGDNVVVVDVERRQVVREFNYLQSKQVQAFIAEYQTEERDSHAGRISVCGSGVVISCAILRGYVAYLDLEREDAVVWLWPSWHRVDALNTVGDLIYGVAEEFPVAWDKYTGEKIWQAAKPTMANKIEIGEQWLVFSHPLGRIQCFNWKQPYISPYRSK